MERIKARIDEHLQRDGARPFCAFLYDLKQLKEHVSRTIALLPPRCRYFYAIKANSDAALLRALAPIVHGFEVASLGEVRKVRAVTETSPILFGGPGKTDEEIAGAIHHRVSLLHVESLNELRRVERIAASHGTVVELLLRVNLRGPLPVGTLQMAGRPTQFGIDEADVPAAILQAQASPHLRLRGFHFHSLSNNLEVEEHLGMVEHYARRVRQWSEEFHLAVDCVNMGGGIGVNYGDLQAQFDMSAFAAKLPARLEPLPSERVSVLFECGRYSVASCGYYAAEVLDVREIRGKTFAVIAGGLHHFLLPGAWKHSHPVALLPVERWAYPFERPECVNRPVTIVGKMDSPKDILAQDVMLPRVRVGDVLAFPYAGAYGWVISAHDFSSLPHPEHLYLE
ncbi:type III PLP-dependent enzyme [Archangium lansingense]|uniref:type III PLP-dependent enzyme n=1 Tax=Archangium lansingense TaxID=2995310 RepID=UPI003B783848